MDDKLFEKLSWEYSPITIKEVKEHTKTEDVFHCLKATLGLFTLIVFYRTGYIPPNHNLNKPFKPLQPTSNVFKLMLFGELPILNNYKTGKDLHEDVTQCQRELEDLLLKHIEECNSWPQEIEDQRKQEWLNKI